MLRCKIFFALQQKTLSRYFALMGFTSHREPIMSKRGGWKPSRRGGREAEGGGLLNRYTLSRRIVGSNPIPSAK